MPPDPEVEAAEALARGDRDAVVTVLMRAYGEPVYRYCRTMLADPHLAEDARQTVFVQAARDLPRFGGRSSFRGWLFGIARHRCYDAARGRRRWWARFGGGDPEVVAEAEVPTEDAGEAARAEAARDPLDDCLQKLTAEVRVAVVMRYLESLSFEDMGQRLRERPGTLQMRVARALPVLRKCMERKGIQP